MTLETMPLDVISVRGRQWKCRNGRADRFQLVYESLIDAMALAGDIAELGSWVGLTARQLTIYLDEIESDKVLHCFDSFKGLDLHDPSFDKERGDWLAEGNPEERFLRRMADLNRWQLHKGHLADQSDFDTPLCWAYVDVDLYEATHHAIDLIERCLVPGGCVVFDDYGEDVNWPGVKKAVDERLAGDLWKVKRMPDTHVWLCFAWKG